MANNESPPKETNPDKIRAANQPNAGIPGVQEFNILQDILQEYVNTLTKTQPMSSQLLARDIQSLCNTVRGVLTKEDS